MQPLGKKKLTLTNHWKFDSQNTDRGKSRTWSGDLLQAICFLKKVRVKKNKKRGRKRQKLARKFDLMALNCFILCIFYLLSQGLSCEGGFAFLVSFKENTWMWSVSSKRMHQFVICSLRKKFCIFGRPQINKLEHKASAVSPHQVMCVTHFGSYT